LRAIGAHQLAAIVELANALFPDGVPPENRDERQRVLDEMNRSSARSGTSTTGSTHPDDTLSLVYDFVIAHPDEVRDT